mmetsp:Transcript_27182/g.82452  ORF Transcript_27182/g.82452 Transcript_27182/m.82452 type:complete len:240 (+) Transcript_27182:1073-1792(+)
MRLHEQALPASITPALTRLWSTRATTTVPYYTVATLTPVEVSPRWTSAVPPPLFHPHPQVLRDCNCFSPANRPHDRWRPRVSPRLARSKPPSRSERLTNSPLSRPTRQITSASQSVSPPPPLPRSAPLILPRRQPFHLFPRSSPHRAPRGAHRRVCNGGGREGVAPRSEERVSLCGHGGLAPNHAFSGDDGSIVFARAVEGRTALRSPTPPSPSRTRQLPPSRGSAVIHTCDCSARSSP